MMMIQSLEFYVFGERSLPTYFDESLLIHDLTCLLKLSLMSILILWLTNSFKEVLTQKKKKKANNYYMDKKI